MKKIFKRDKRLHHDSIKNSVNRRPKMFWKFVKQHTRKAHRTICLCDGSDNASHYQSAPAEVANMFADYFKNCFPVGNHSL